MPKVSVIVPVYNVERYLNRCVDSILSQTIRDFEVILINDGSQDRSGEICDRYAKQDARVRVIHLNNGGVSAARNLGLKLAKGEYITFIDSDDYVKKTYLEEMMAPECDLSVCGFYKCLPDGKCERHDFPYLGLQTKTIDKLSHWFEEGVLYTVWGKMFKREIIRSNNLFFYTDMSYGEDNLFALEYVSYCTSVSFVGNILYWYVKYKEKRLTSTIGKDSIRSYHLLDVRIRDWLNRNGVMSTRFDSCNFSSKYKLKHAFFQIYENTEMSARDKYNWYRLFFSLSTFNNNIDLLFDEYPRKIRILLHMKNAAILVAFQWICKLPNIIC